LLDVQFQQLHHASWIAFSAPPGCGCEPNTWKVQRPEGVVSWDIARIDATVGKYHQDGVG
jgi:hypothetical protein